FKSLYGKGVKTSLTDVFDPELIDGIELGLSSNTEMADHITELQQYTYVSNSDAQSLAKIAREYQEIIMAEPSFIEFARALQHVNGRKIHRNFGMNPKLGKYYTTVCGACLQQVSPNINLCPHCQHKRIVKAVNDGFKSLASNDRKLVLGRFNFLQLLQKYLPHLGPKPTHLLLDQCQTEMKIIHYVPYEELKKVVSEKLAQMIVKMRQGQLDIKAGGGGKYGKVKLND